MEKDFSFEFILTDNDSTDGSWKILEDFARADKRFKIFKLSRNFGYQKSIWTGYCKSTGDAVIEFDCDLQDPPELLPVFLEKWEKGSKVVYGVRQKRNEKFLQTRQVVDLPFVRPLFYFILRKMSAIDIPVNAGDFMLLDRKIVNILTSINDHNIYLRGTVFSLGFSRSAVHYSRESRKYGTTKFIFQKSLKLALDGIISQSALPLKFASIFGILASVVTLLLCGFYLGAKIFTDAVLPDGFTTLVVLTLFGISVNGLFLGIIGEYLGRIYDQQKSRPITLIEKELNTGEND